MGLRLHQRAGEGIAEVSETVHVANVQPAEHGEECGECLCNAHGDVQVSAVCDPVRTGLVRHVWPRLHQRPPLVRRWGDVVTDHKPHCIYRLLDICPHDNAEGEVGEEQPENDAGKAPQRSKIKQYSNY